MGFSTTSNLQYIFRSDSDEFYTPEYGVMPIIKYLNPEWRIWCPWDTEKSHYVKLLRKNGFDVVASHIDTGTDFLNCDVPECDAIVSNPPFKGRTKTVKRLYEIGKPFAILMNAYGFFDGKERWKLFKEQGVEIMIFDNRIDFFKDYDNEFESVR